MQYHHTPIITAKIQKTENTECSRGFRKRGTLIHCWWDANWYGHSGGVWQFLIKLNIDLPYDPAITLLRVHPSELKTYIYTKPCMQMFTGALFITAKTGNSIDVPQSLNG